MFSDGKTVTVASTPENWGRNLPSDHGKAYSSEIQKATVEIDEPITEIVVFPTEMDAN